MTRLATTRCCAVSEIDNLSHSETPREALDTLIRSEYFGDTWDIPNMVTFTGVIKRRVEDHASGRRDNYGAKFAQFLKEEKLGTVDCGIKAVVNRETGNTVKMWIWYPNTKNLTRYANKVRNARGA